MRDSNRFYLYTGAVGNVSEFASLQDREDEVKRMVVQGEYDVDSPDYALIGIDLGFDEKGEPILSAWEFSNGYLEDFLLDETTENAG